MARSKRERSKGATREALIEAAVAEFSERGLDAPSLDAICSRAGFTRGAFYVHFRNREELVVAVVQRALGAFFDAIIATGDGPHDLERTVRRFEEALVGISALRLPGRGAGDGSAGVPFHRLVEACTRSPALRAQLVRLLREAVERVAKTAGAGQGAGTVRTDVDAEALATLLVTLALGFVAALDAGLPFDAPAARRAVLALLAPRGR